MRLAEVAKKKPNGTYVGIRPSKDSAEKIRDVTKKVGVQNPHTDKLHATLIYSRKYLPKFKPRGKLEEPITAKVTGFEIFPSAGGTNVLVIRMESPELTARHEEIMDKHDATYDYDEFKPHLTISYDCGDFDPKSYDVKKDIPEIVFDDEYDEELNFNWVDSNKD